MGGSETERLLDAIRHYQNSLERYAPAGNTQKMLHAIAKLSRLPIKMTHLEQTGVGRTVNQMKKIGGEVGDAARALVDHWKEMVQTEQNESEDEETHNDKSLEGPASPDHNESDHNDYENDSDHLEISSPKDSRTKDTNRKRSLSPENNKKIIKKRKHNESDSDNYSSDNHRKKSGHNEKDKSSKHRKSSESDTGSEESESEQSSESDSDSDRDKSKKSKSKDSDRRKNHKISNHNKRGSSVSSSDDRSKKKDSSKSSKDKDRHNSKDYKKDRVKSSKTDDKKHSSSEENHKKSRDKDAKHSSSSEKNQKHKKHESSSSSKSKHREDSSRSKEDKSKEKDRKSEHRDKSKDKGSSSKDKDSKKEKDSKKQENKEVLKGKDSSERDSKKIKDKESKKEKDETSSTKKSDKTKESTTRDKEKSDKSKESGSRDKEKSKPTQHSPPKPKKSSLGIHIDSESGTSFADVLGMLEPPRKVKKKVIQLKNEIDSESGASFADALGMCEPSSSSKSSSRKSKSDTVDSSRNNHSKDTNDEKGVPNLLKESKLEPLDLNVDVFLPPPNYKPLGAPIEHSNRMVLNGEDMLNRVITNKNQRTKVYSGNKTYTKVPSLFDISVRFLQDNLDALEFTGGVPYYILKPILDRANPDQLYMLEHHNPYLIEDTDELWQLHCQKDFKNKKREELESWREMYMRCLDEREMKLKALTANIKQSQDKSLPVRTTKLAFVDDFVKPPRNVLRKQVKNGTAHGDRVPLPVRKKELATSGEAGKISVPNPVQRNTERTSTSHQKPKKAPLMAKLLSSMKGSKFPFGRR